MKNVVYGIAGFIIGGICGYVLAKYQYKKKLEKEISSIEQTQEELYLKKKKDNSTEDVEKVEEAVNENTENQSETITIVENDTEDEDEDEWEDYDTKAKIEFMQKFSGYVGTCIPYPITQEQYEEDDLNCKMKLIYYPEEDKAYSDFDNTVYDGFHEDVGDETYDTLNDENCFDIPGVWYIRNDNEGIDFEIEIGNRILEDR